MNYHVRRQGEYLGCFPLEELARRRESGEFTGVEYVQAEGTKDWQPLGMVLTQGYRTVPPPVPQTNVRRGPNPTLVWTGIAGGIVLCLLFVVGMAYVMLKIQSQLPGVNQTSRNNALNEINPAAVATAGKPIVWDQSSKTVRDQQKRETAFRLRLWVDGYEKHGTRTPKCDAEADSFLHTYAAQTYESNEKAHSAPLADESDKLARDPNCTDPLVLTAAADQSLNQFDSIRLLRRALAAYPGSSHQAYPQLFATIRLVGLLGYNSDQAGPLETSALQLLKQCFTDGSFTTNNQQEIAEIFINEWGYDFFKENAPSICNIATNAGPQYKWLTLVLNGEHEIVAAWAARGDGDGDSVTDEGWQGFRSHLGISRGYLTAAWTMRPTWPIAPDRMMTVALGDSDLNEMRAWFDRTTTAQIDYAQAWSEMRWGLRPRWYGNEKAMLALGVAGINTGRFDTDVPGKYLDCVYDVESEMGLPIGKHIFGRPDIWPNLKRMYDGYVNAPNNDHLSDWRTTYAVVAYFAGRYDVARAQLDALNWNPVAAHMEDWGVDLSLMPLEVDARTGPLGAKISAAESAREYGDFSRSLKEYAALKDAPQADDRTREFMQCRLSELTMEKELNDGHWVSLLPSRDDDHNWVFSFGKVHVLPDGSAEVESGPKGHMFYSRVRAGMNFEVRGQFELVRSTNKNFQGGVVMGVPDFNGYNWYGFRLKRHRGEEGDVTCFAQGWSRDQIAQHIVLNDVTNAFDMTFQDGKVTAFVNGINVFDHADPPRGISVPNNSFLVGLGAFNDSAETVIRYRNVQLRKL